MCAIRCKTVARVFVDCCSPFVPIARKRKKIKRTLWELSADQELPVIEFPGAIQFDALAIEQFVIGKIHLALDYCRFPCGSTAARNGDENKQADSLDGRFVHRWARFQYEATSAMKL